MIFGLDKYAAALTFKAMKALVRWLCYDNIISGDLSVPYADKGRHIEFQTKEGTAIVKDIQLIFEPTIFYLRFHIHENCWDEF